MSRAMLAARSALLRWSAAMISILRPSTSPPKSSAAILAAVSLPGAGDIGVKARHIEDAAELERRLVLAPAPRVAATAPAAQAKTPVRIRFIMKASLIDAALPAATISVAAIMPHALYSGKPRQACDRVFPLKRNDLSVRA